jgi:nitrogen-specific signal transduction histidine kinase
VKAQDFKPEKLLTYMPEKGVISLNDMRMLLISTEAFGFLRKDLVNTLGEGITRGILIRYGYQFGYSDAIRLAKKFDWDTDLDRMSVGPMMHMLEGVAHVDLKLIEFDREKGNFTMEGVWLNSFEAEQHLKHFGKGKAPVCWTLIGYASGYATAFFGKSIVCLETECMGKGDDRCYWVMKPADVWGNKAKEIVNFLESVDIKGRLDLLEQIVDEKTKALKVTHEYLRQAEKLIAMGEISAKIAHEIRNPLTVIGGFSNLLRKRAKLRLPEEKYTEIIVNEVARLEKFINDILLYSREIPMEKKGLNINKLITEVLLLFDKDLIQQDVSVNSSFDESIPLIPGDKKKLEEAFINIIINAIHAMEKGGNLTLQTQYLKERIPKTIKITISDTGKGIPRDVLGKVFDPYFTTKTVGSGLGLTIARQILKRHNGTIGIRSEFGKGTKVTVTLTM